MAALAERGIVPGLGTVLVGDDPGSQIYVAGKHRDCAEVGIASIRGDLPATATQAEVEAAIDELNADPACTGYIVQLPLPAAPRRQPALLELIDPAKDADGLHPINLGRLVLMVDAARCRARRAASSSCCALRRADQRRRGRRGRPRHHRRPPARPAAHPALRERHRHPVPHRHPGPGRAHPRAPTSSSRRPGVPDLITADMVKPGAAVLDVGVSRVDGKIAGDVAPDVGEVAGFFAPNPGGVGPMTRAMLLTNVVEAAEKAGPEPGQDARRFAVVAALSSPAAAPGCRPHVAAAPPGWA